MGLHKDPERARAQGEVRAQEPKELWILDSELRRIRKNVRDVLSGRTEESVGRDIIARLSRYNIVKGDAKLDDLLVVNVDSFLERRLQTVVLRKGLAKSMKQARQLVAHGLIAVNGRRVTSPATWSSHLRTTRSAISSP